MPRDRYYMTSTGLRKAPSSSRKPPHRFPPPPAPLLPAANQSLPRQCSLSSRRLNLTRDSGPMHQLHPQPLRLPARKGEERRADGNDAIRRRMPALAARLTSMSLFGWMSGLPVAALVSQCPGLPNTQRKPTESRGTLPTVRATFRVYLH